jgi:hypothetical protein
MACGYCFGPHQPAQPPNHVPPVLRAPVLNPTEPNPPNRPTERADHHKHAVLRLQPSDLGPHDGGGCPGVQPSRHSPRPFGLPRRPRRQRPQLHRPQLQRPRWQRLQQQRPRRQRPQQQRPRRQQREQSRRGRRRGGRRRPGRRCSPGQRVCAAAHAGGRAQPPVQGDRIPAHPCGSLPPACLPEAGCDGRGGAGRWGWSAWGWGGGGAWRAAVVVWSPGVRTPGATPLAKRARVRPPPPSQRARMKQHPCGGHKGVSLLGR